MLDERCYRYTCLEFAEDIRLSDQTLQKATLNGDSYPETRHVFHRAVTGNRIPPLQIATTGNDFGDNIIKLASKFKTLRIRFVTRHGRFTPGIQPMPRATVNDFRSALQALTRKAPKDTISWGKHYVLRKADASMQFIFQALRHVTTLHLGGSTNCLPWDITDAMENLENLQFIGVTNANMSRNCILLAYRPAFNMLEFLNIAITVGFLEFFPGTCGITATVLQFNNCWVPAKGVERIVKAFENLVTFEYSFKATLSEAQPYWLRRWQLGQFVSTLCRHK